MDSHRFYFTKSCLWEQWWAQGQAQGWQQPPTCETAVSKLGVTSSTLMGRGPFWNSTIHLTSPSQWNEGASKEISTSLCNFSPCSSALLRALLDMAVPTLSNQLSSKTSNSPASNPLSRFYLQYLSTSAAQIVHFCIQTPAFIHLQRLPHEYDIKLILVHHIGVL